MNNIFDSKLRTLVEHAWDQEVRWAHIESWLNNFNGQVYSKEKEQLYATFALTRFMYFSKRLIREMLKSLYRDHFKAPLMQRIRRNYNHTKDLSLLQSLYQKELSSTRFIGVGNPAESGAHLLYYFRQVNYLPKDLFVDFYGAFTPTPDQSRKNEQLRTIRLNARNPNVTRFVFFDDLVGSGTQASQYLTHSLAQVRSADKTLELRFMSLFATSIGLRKMNESALFDGKAVSLFELDDTYKTFDNLGRYFATTPDWFDKNEFYNIAYGYGKQLKPSYPLGYKDGQLLLAFFHNTPDNTLPIFWDEGLRSPWSPVFARFDKQYGGV